MNEECRKAWAEAKKHNLRWARSCYTCKHGDCEPFMYSPCCECTLHTGKEAFHGGLTAATICNDYEVSERVEKFDCCFVLPKV